MIRKSTYEATPSEKGISYAGALRPSFHSARNDQQSFRTSYVTQYEQLDIIEVRITSTEALYKLPLHVLPKQTASPKPHPQTT